MALITSSGPETLPIGKPGPDFSLPATDGQTYSLASFADSKALVLNFTCNHCPYAKAYEDRYIALAQEFVDRDIAFLAICSNDAANYPDDSFPNMKKLAESKAFPFPYLHDETQEVARAYGAVCTPHLFVLDAERKLVYEGRIDNNWKEPAAATSHDLHNALTALLNGQPVPVPQTGPMGCSIKWK